jgi:hypothetical protein
MAAYLLFTTVASVPHDNAPTKPQSTKYDRLRYPNNGNPSLHSPIPLPFQSPILNIMRGCPFNLLWIHPSLPKPLFLIEVVSIQHPNGTLSKFIHKSCSIQINSCKFSPKTSCKVHSISIQQNENKDDITHGWWQKSWAVNAFTLWNHKWV